MLFGDFQCKIKVRVSMCYMAVQCVHVHMNSSGSVVHEARFGYAVA